MLSQAGFDVTDFSASLGNHSTPEAVRERMEWYIQWMENLPLFDRAVEMGWVDRPTLDHLPTRMRRWSEQPDAFLAIASCMAIGWKE
jgi:DNA-binding LacI/PurR family transcriptional regulator